VGKVADEQLIDQVDGPKDIVDKQQDPVVVIVPTDHKCIQAEKEIDDAGGSSVVHGWCVDG
jgi:hypothetical protein